MLIYFLIQLFCIKKSNAKVWFYISICLSFGFVIIVVCSDRIIPIFSKKRDKTNYLAINSLK